MSRTKLAIKIISFILITLLCVTGVNRLLLPKYYYNTTWPSTSTYEDFYRLEKNTVDVLFFGSSHGMSAFNPQVIYDKYGITSYNLSSEQQSVLVTYFWLKEALRYQTPKAVVIDTYTFHKYTDAYVYNRLNCSEAAIRKAIDPMRPSLVKIAAAREIEKWDSTQSALSFFLTNMRYHTRWTRLGENDYDNHTMIEHGGIKGYTVLGGGISSSEKDETFKDSDIEDAEAEPMVEVATVFLEKIIALCRKSNIDVIFVNVPQQEGIGKYKSVKEYSEQKGISFYDFNEESLYNEIGYDAKEDWTGHLSYKGAEKVSLYIGKLLSEEYGIPSRKDTSFEKSREVYEHKVKNCELSEVTDVYEYLNMINDDSYCVFITFPETFNRFIDDELSEKIRCLGFETDLCNLADGLHYLGIRSREGIIENTSGSDVSFSGAIRGGKTTYIYNIDTSKMMDRYHTYSLTIDGVECSNETLSLHAIIFDYDEKKVVDKVDIITDSEELLMKHY